MCLAKRVKGFIHPADGNLPAHMLRALGGEADQGGDEVEHTFSIADCVQQVPG